MSWAVAAHGSASDLRAHLAQRLGPDPEAAAGAGPLGPVGCRPRECAGGGLPAGRGGRAGDRVSSPTGIRRSADLRARDRDRVLRPDWFQRPDAVGYAAYADRFAGTLKGVAERVDYLRELGVTYLHLMPLLRAAAGRERRRVRGDGLRPGPRGPGHDGRPGGAGRDAARQRDLADPRSRAQPRGGRACVGVAARAGDAEYRDYFYVYPDRTVPDAVRAVAAGGLPGLRAGQLHLGRGPGRWVWTTFNAWQWDLNWSNPDVVRASSSRSS